MTTTLDQLHATAPERRAAQGWESRSLEDNERLFRQGDPADTLYVIAEGELALLVDGVEIETIGAGESLGEASVFFPGDIRLGGCVSRGPSKVFALPRPRLLQLRRALRAPATGAASPPRRPVRGAGSAPAPRDARLL